MSQSRCSRSYHGSGSIAIAVGIVVGVFPALILQGARHQLLPLLAVPVIGLVWIGVGWLVGRALATPVSKVVQLGIGAGVCNTLMFVVGLTVGYENLFLPWSLLVFAPIGIVALASERPTARPSAGESLLRGAQGALLGLLVLVVVVPVMDPDTMTYHFALPELWHLAGEFKTIPTLHYSFLPLGAEQGFLLLRSMFSSSHAGWTAAQGAGLLYGLLLARGVASLAPRTASGRLGGEIGATLVLAVPMTLLVCGLPYNDAYGTAFAVLALAELFRWVEKRTIGGAVIVGLLVGFAMGGKTTLLVVGPVIVVATWIAFGKLDEWKEWLRGCLVMGSAAAVVWLPWVVHTTIATGNPVYPWAFSVFGGTPGGAPAWDAVASQINGAAAALGAGWNPVRWITAPFELWTQPLGFGALPRIGPNLLLAFPFVFWALRRGGERRERALAIAMLALYVFWSVTARNARFLLPAMACGLAIVGLTAAQVFEKRASVYRLAAVALVVSMLAWDATAAVTSFSKLLNPVAYLLGNESRDQYMDARRRPSIVLRWASSTLPDDARVLMIGEGRSLGLERDRLVGGALDASPLLWLEVSTGADGFIEAVTASDFTHVMFDGPQAFHLADQRKRYRGRAAELVELKRRLDSNARLLFEDKGIQVYDVDGLRTMP